jgi:hypothetical protein
MELPEIPVRRTVHPVLRLPRDGTHGVVAQYASKLIPRSASRSKLGVRIVSLPA